MNQYKLHSRGDNWFHFRLKIDSVMESFSITYLHDGTVCMSGDLGCLTWQREYFPKRPDYGFPYKDTGIGYFAEKICRTEECQKIEDWKYSDKFRRRFEMLKSVSGLILEAMNVKTTGG